jgi:hypothetical protein
MLDENYNGLPFLEKKKRFGFILKIDEADHAQ